jgi:hypothetical protein
MKYRFRATRAFWRSFAKLPTEQQSRARKAFAIFKQNPFDPRLRSHKIQKLSARYGRAIYLQLRIAKWLQADRAEISFCRLRDRAFRV